MADLRSDVKDYFEHFVREVDLDDLLDATSYVIDAVPPAEPRQRRAWWRMRGPVAAAAAGVLVWGIIGLTGGTPTGNSPAVNAGSSATTTVMPPSAGPVPEAASDELDLTYPWVAHGWETFGDFRLQKSATGPQDAEAILYWVDYPTSRGEVTLCGPIGDLGGFVRAVDAGLPIPPDVAELEDPNFNLYDTVSNVIATYPGLRLVSGPTNVLVSGYRGRQLSLVIEADEGCDPGYFANWKAEYIGAMWMNYTVGGTIDVLIVDTTSQDQSTLLIVGIADPDVPNLRDEIKELIRSVTLQTR